LEGQRLIDITTLNKGLTEVQKEKRTKNHTKDLKNTPNIETLQVVVEAWAELPESVKNDIMAMVKSVKGEG